ncbi:uncharacterized protein LAESUDRAFT_728877 [Laetiporus sulphureus 93-53]|uniref:Uncharacterized protein n=1 Tax=Laetiporus sulphureus 93-53 TaxID=1314785 RepID=A0A165CWP7_9APHY|nr:uncharacterized protein LAESUDRAFT_728877 [Laetiporus sulphureus 93-53]KZT03604.1 hypothetical protein LAESUDRAFT_728877 [Laetiporus sulphureus 93-53]
MDSTRAAHMDIILGEIQRCGWTIGSFLFDLFTLPPHSRKDRNIAPVSQLRIQMVSKFFHRETSMKAHHHAYFRHFARPLPSRSGQNRRNPFVIRTLSVSTRIVC